MPHKGADMMAALVGKPSGDLAPLEADSDLATDPGNDAPEVPPDFEDYALQAFPELEDDPARISALFQAMKAAANG